jgi:hypothetical protein
MFPRNNGQVWISKPRKKKSDSKGVWIYPGEEVQWHCTRTSLGTMVTGYTFKPSKKNVSEEEDPDKG